jgi:SagB-type dehydrogenase family enzyme
VRLVKRRPVRFRRAPFVVSYWRDDELIFENYATRHRISAAPLTAELLQFFDHWRSVGSLSAHFSDFTPSSLRTVVSTLERHTLLQRSDRPVDVREAMMAAWAPWNPAAGFFHFSTKDVRYAADDDEVDRALLKKSKRTPMPASIKRYPGARHYSLPAVIHKGEFPNVLLARRTWRDFSRRAISLADLSTMLGLTWRVQNWLDLSGLGRVPLKTSPSGGARHPVEVYVLASRVNGLPRGLYHYAGDRHRLELLRAGASARQIVRYLPTQWWFGGAAALMLMTAVFPRTQWKYGFPRAYRVVLADAGHLCQTFCLTATWLGLAPFCTMALADSRIEADLGLDGITESVLYAAGVGVRPTGVDSPP